MFGNWFISWVCHYIYLHCDSVEMLAIMIPLSAQASTNWAGSARQWLCLTQHGALHDYFPESFFVWNFNKNWLDVSRGASCSKIFTTL